MALIDVVYKDVKQFLETNEELLFNERDFQMHLANYLRWAGHYDDVDVEYYVPLSELTLKDNLNSVSCRLNLCQ